MIGDTDPRPMVPVTVDLDKDEYTVEDERVCPVCIVKRRWDNNPVRFASFTHMMRHWEAMHPNEAPPSDRDGNKPVQEMEGLIWEINAASIEVSNALIDAWLNAEGEVKE